MNSIISKSKIFLHKLKKESTSKLKMPIVHMGYKPQLHFITIGIQKGGTSSLHIYMNNHPSLSASKVKEIDFFSSEVKYSKGFEKYYSYFPLKALLNKSKVFETSPSYTNPYSDYYKISAKRIQVFNPNIKLIVILRNPIDRAFSAWNMYHHSFRHNAYYQSLVDDRKFEDAIKEELIILEGKNNYIENHFYNYLSRGIYYPIINTYLQYFNKENLLVLENNELKTDLAGTLYRITEFLDLPIFDWEKIDFSTKNKGKYTAKMNPKLREELADFYSPHNQRLFNLIGKTYPWD